MPATKTTVAVAVMTAPVPLSTARVLQRRERRPYQCRTSPVWLMVKPMNTPIAYNGISRWVSADVATSSTAASRPRATTPYR
ncbi:hypothetical protein [Actinomadura opuntiae]|uniref:hypothetical protein n=1 Tax=Actinomadura sp. OS1-43 TaxID=604315 RepID=UPI00255A9F58|nr:hypothetical protein [Actinomadura sp. OS1-43]MDL4815259.1 hypothetical protein [Actinomadura sp. OS1-43]